MTNTLAYFFELSVTKKGGLIDQNVKVPDVVVAGLHVAMNDIRRYRTDFDLELFHFVLFQFISVFE